MRILVYCQHVLGIGHLIRTFEILKALDGHQVTLMLGGSQTEIPIPAHVTTFQLPPLMMDTSFSALLTVENRPVESVKAERVEKISSIFKQTRPDILLIELYPFGRNGFHFELEPLLQLARHDRSSCLIASSVRDILVDRDNQVKFEQRAIDRLNRYFDLLLVHSDPDVIALDETFSRMGDVAIPVIYTGYINRSPNTDSPHATPETGPPGEIPLIVASAGGGSVGYALLEATVRAHSQLTTPCALHLYTGPYLDDTARTRLRSLAAGSAVIEKFCPDFPAELAGADLSISMGGYNTTMDVVTAGCPALIYPFEQNHEQRLRALRLGEHIPITLLDSNDLEATRLAGYMEHGLKQHAAKPNIRLNGAEETARAVLRAAKRKQESL